MTIRPFIKPQRGSGPRRRARRLRESRASEKSEKDKVRERDGHRCRIPTCRTMYSTEVAHMKHKSMGGNPTNDRSVARLMILFCWAHHQGPRGLDKGGVTVTPLDAKLGTNGPCRLTWIDKDGTTHEAVA